jgi:hypothetical protein
MGRERRAARWCKDGRREFVASRTPGRVDGGSWQFKCGDRRAAAPVAQDCGLVSQPADGQTRRARCAGACSSGDPRTVDQRARSLSACRGGATARAGPAASAATSMRRDVLHRYQELPTSRLFDERLSDVGLPIATPFPPSMLTFSRNCATPRALSRHKAQWGSAHKLHLALKQNATV